jgi:hypothetical protein
MRMEVNNYVISLSSLIELLLRRTLVLSVLYSSPDSYRDTIDHSQL